MSTSQQTDPLIGRLVDGRYRVRARIARGGMATVYVATDLRLERRVALKVMHGHLSDDTVFQSRFIQEARAAARLADPHVVNVFDQGQDGEMAYLVMEYLPGITLRELLREQRRLTVPQTISIMDAALSGLAAAHRAGIVHRDVKPENILLAEDGRIKIGDFGLARATTANTASGAQLLGTIAYLAPELVTRGTADARSDIYALGILLYEMLVGEQPYQGEQPMQIAYQHATDSVPRPSVKNPGVPEALDELVLWSTERDPDDRPSDAREMLERLREIERELGITPQVTRTTPIQIDPVSDDDSGGHTKLLPSTMTGPVVETEEEIDNATRLRQVTKRRSAKGGWLIVLVLVLAGLAGGAGWWFGSGPGSLVPVPHVEGLTFEEASQQLADRSLVAIEQSETSIDVPAGLVVRTDPPSGDRLERESQVSVFVSLGPAEVTLPDLQYQSKDAVTTTLRDEYRITVDAENGYYTDADVDAVVDLDITPRGGGDTIACAQGCVAHEGDAATLSVSLGNVPDVAGMSVQDATDALADLDISVASDRPEEYNDDIAAGAVIRMAERSTAGWWRPGDIATLVVSLGPEPIEVPDVVGSNLADAMAALTDAGFRPSTVVPEFVWGLFTVSSTNPEGGTLQQRGTEISVRAAG